MRTAPLAKTSLISTLLLVVVGGFTRGSGSGYGCADRWPLCEGGALGGLLPRWEYHMIVEWSHRWLAALVGVAVVMTAVRAWRDEPRRTLVTWSASLAVVVVGIQAWVGRLVVKGQLAGDLVVLHLAISMLVVMLLTVLVVASGQSASAGSPTGDRRGLIVMGTAAGGSLALLLLGSAVHNLYFPGWPLMFDRLMPDLSNFQTLAHFLHRALAGIMLIYLGWVAVRDRRRGAPQFLQWLTSGAAAVLLFNVGVGAAHVVTRVESAVLVAVHLGLGATVWSLLVAATTAEALARRRSNQELAAVAP